MKKILDLKSERADLISKMEVIVSGESMTEEQRTEWNGNDTRVKSIDEEIALLERQENLNKTNIKKMENTIERKPVVVEFRDWLREAVETGKNTSFRADPILASTDTDMITKTVAPGIDVIPNPGEQFLRDLGVTFYENLQGNFSVPSMDSDLATFVAEDASGASADMLPDSLVLQARRLTHQQSITRETLAQTNPGVYQSILANLVEGIGNALVKDVMATVISDAATQVKVTSTTVTNTDILNMEASLGGKFLGKPAFVTSPVGRALLKGTIARGTTAGDAIWRDDNTVNGYKAVAPATTQLTANRCILGDWSKEVVGKFGGYEIVVDPYSQAHRGRIILTIIALVDTGNANKRAFAILDASLS